jgi:hypothetical protein
MALADRSAVPEIVIRGGSVPDRLAAPIRTAEKWESDRGQFLLRLANIGKFLIRDGREIAFELDGACDERGAALYLLGTCFAILLQQRGNLVLHASAIAAGGRAMLFCGQSGAGKSTMAALLCRRGYPLLNDDVCNLTAVEGGYEVRPDGRMLKLWSTSLDELEWEKRESMAVRQDMEKYFFAPPVSEADPQPVGAIYILRPAEPGEAPSIERLRTLEGMVELKQNAYRPALVSAMDREKDYFAASAALQRSAGVFVLRRPLDFGGSGVLLDLLESHWKTLGLPG